MAMTKEMIVIKEMAMKKETTILKKLTFKKEMVLMKITIMGLKETKFMEKIIGLMGGIILFLLLVWISW